MPEKSSTTRWLVLRCHAWTGLQFESPAMPGLRFYAAAPEDGCEGYAPVYLTEESARAAHPDAEILPVNTTSDAGRSPTPEAPR